MDRRLGNSNQNNSSLHGITTNRSNSTASSSSHDPGQESDPVNTDPTFDIHVDTSDATSMATYRASLENTGTAKQFNDPSFVDDDSLILNNASVIETQGPQYGLLSRNPSTFNRECGNGSSLVNDVDGTHLFDSRIRQQSDIHLATTRDIYPRVPLGELQVPVSRVGNDGSVMASPGQEDMMNNYPQPSTTRSSKCFPQSLSTASRAQTARYSVPAVNNQPLTVPTHAIPTTTTNSGTVIRASRSTHTTFDGSNDSGEQYIHENHSTINTCQSRPRPASPPPADPYSEPPTSFPLPPQDLILPPPRLAPQTPTLESLDHTYQQKEHLILDTQKYGSGEDEARSRLAWEALEGYKRDRMPFVKLAGERLQAFLGVRNELVFELPNTSIGVHQRRASLSPQIQRLYDGPPSTSIFPGTRKHGKQRIMNPKDLSISTNTSRRDSGIGLGSVHGPKSPIGFENVDRDTGRGLREFLLQQGRLGGMRKRECRGISFHDFTGDMKGGRVGNLLLGNFESGRGRRLDVYTVDLPGTQIDPTTGMVGQATETWIWFLISRPLLVLTSSPISADDPSTSTTTTAVPSTGNIPFCTPQTHSSRIPLAACPTPPPNFPHPIPTSWVVFALPLANCTAYPETIEDISPSFSSGGETSFDSGYHSFFQSESKVDHKRADYDLSHSGIPIFEFSQKPNVLFKGWTEFCAKHGELNPKSGEPTHDESFYAPALDGSFLSIDEIPSWDRKKDNNTDFNERVTREWWDKWNMGMACEVERWGSIRRAMGRGKCRVVVRWEESTLPVGLEYGERTMEIEMDVDKAPDMIPNYGLGISGLGDIDRMGKSPYNLHNPKPRASTSNSRLASMSGMGIGSRVGLGMGVGGRPKRATRSSLSSQLVNTPNGYISMSASSPSVNAAAGSAARKKKGKKGKGRKR